MTFAVTQVEDPFDWAVTISSCKASLLKVGLEDSYKEGDKKAISLNHVYSFLALFHVRDQYPSGLTVLPGYFRRSTYPTRALQASVLSVFCPPEYIKRRLEVG